MSTYPELIAPAGSFEKMKYAYAYGADAVYAGVPKFSLRARENEFNIQGIEKAVKYARENNKRIYLTLNIFPHNRKIESFKETLRWMDKLKPDAIIIADPGIILFAKELCPDIPLHLSTQANTVNWAAVKFWFKVGIRRLILSRELSLVEIAEIKNRVPGVELEAFVHGAICMAYSGRCLLSSYFNYRDPNQGTCTNSCRWQYRLYHKSNNTPNTDDYYLEETKRPGEFLPIDEDEHGTYIMSSKDMCAIELLSQLREAGIDGFKIEGRTKSPYYLSIITRAYRNVMDDMQKGKALDIKWKKEVFTVANRGYIAGFLERGPDHHSQDYTNSHVNNHTHIFCGTVKKIDKSSGEILISVRNRFEEGDQLEMISPRNSFLFTVGKIYSVDGKRLEQAHGGGQDVVLHVPGSVSEFSIIRKLVKRLI